MSIARLRQANAVTTQILVGRGIRVTQQGSEAYVASDPVTNEPVYLNLPFLPDDAPQGLADAVQGFIDHEGGGHILFTDWGVRASAVAEGLGSSHNMVEDCYVERAMADAFPGSSENLGKLHAFFTTEVTPSLLREAGGDEALRFGALVVPAVRALSGQGHFAAFMDEGRHWDRPSVQAFLAAFGPTGLEGLRRLRSSADCLEVARLLEVAMGRGRAAALGPSPTPVWDGEATGRMGSAEGASVTSEARGALGQTGDARPEAGDGEGRAAFGSPCDAAGDQGTGIPSPGDGGQGGGASRRSAPSGVEAAGGGTAGASPSAPTADPFSSAVARAISERAEAAVANAPYRVWSRDFDVIEPLPPCDDYDDEWLAALDGAVAESAGALQRRFERAMAARGAARFVAGFRSGRLHAGSLHKVALGDDRVFGRRQEAPMTASALSLLVDNSGSMLGNACGSPWWRHTP